MKKLKFILFLFWASPFILIGLLIAFIYVGIITGTHSMYRELKDLGIIDIKE